jgi:hypothetical protein
VISTRIFFVMSSKYGNLFMIFLKIFILLIH